MAQGPQGLPRGVSSVAMLANKSGLSSQKGTVEEYFSVSNPEDPEQESLARAKSRVRIRCPMNDSEAAHERGICNNNIQMEATELHIS